MKIKVCGMKEPGNIKQLTMLKPDYIGFIHYAKSPRFAGEMDIAFLSNLPESVEKTAVFVNEEAEHIESLIKQYGFTAIQLHGQESPEFCKLFKGKVQVLKAYGIDDTFNFEQLTPYVPFVDIFLFDTKTDQHGGSGQTFNWQVLSKYNLDVPFMLSGGLSLENIGAVKEIKHPQFYGVDLNSRFETAPGIKDIIKLTEAFNILRQSITDEIRS